MTADLASESPYLHQGLVALAIAFTSGVHFAARYLRKAKQKPSQNGRSGQASVEFWELKFGQILEEKITKALTPVRETLERIERHISQ